METMMIDKSKLTAEQFEVCEYLEGLDIQEKYINEILNNGSFYVYNNFEDYVHDELFQLGCELPIWVDIDYLQTFKNVCTYSNDKNYYFKDNFEFSERDLYEKDGLKEFEQLSKFSKFVYIYGLEC